MHRYKIKESSIGEWKEEDELAKIGVLKKGMEEVSTRRLEVLPTVKIHAQGREDNGGTQHPVVDPRGQFRLLDKGRIILRERIQILKQMELELTKDLNRMQSKH